MLGRHVLQLVLQIELDLLRRSALCHIRDALEHGTDLVLDEKHDRLVRDAVPARRLRPSNICARGTRRSLRPNVVGAIGHCPGRLAELYASG